MSDEPELDEEDVPKKKSKLPLILGVVLALAGGGGGFFAVQSGLLGGGPEETEEAMMEEEPGPEDPALPDVVFVELEPIVVSLVFGGNRGHLRFRANLEVPPEHLEEIQGIEPRIVDILNSYLRAVDVEELEDPAALPRLRSQMLRRVQVVSGQGRVRDLLILEFVLT